MNIPIELCGYKGWLTGISSRIAYLPWHKEDELLVRIEFEQPYPENIISTAISIPVKNYSRSEFLVVVKEKGEEQIPEILARHRKDREEAVRRHKKDEELKSFAAGLETKIA